MIVYRVLTYEILDLNIELHNNDNYLYIQRYFHVYILSPPPLLRPFRQIFSYEKDILLRKTAQTKASYLMMLFGIEKRETAEL